MASKRKKKYSNKGKCDKMIVGLILSWEDPDPLDDNDRKFNMNVSHTNHTHRMYARDIAFSSLAYIRSRQAFYWQVDVLTVFNVEGGKFNAPVSMTAYGTMDDINDQLLEEIKENRRRGPEDGYSHVKIKFECIGRSPPPPIEHELAKYLGGSL